MKHYNHESIHFRFGIWKYCLGVGNRQSQTDRSAKRDWQNVTPVFLIIFHSPLLIPTLIMLWHLLFFISLWKSVFNAFPFFAPYLSHTVAGIRELILGLGIISKIKIPLLIPVPLK